MTLQKPSSGTTNVVVAELGTVDDCYVATDVWIDTSAIYAVHATGSGQSVEVDGLLQCDNHTIWLGDDNAADRDYKVLIGETGRVDAGLNGMFINGANSSLTNHGLVIADNLAVIMGGRASGTKSVITNDGVITGAYGGIYADSASETVVLHNTGTIQSHNKSYWATEYYDTSGADKIHNSGKMIGDILTASGNDLYDGRNGMIIGEVHAGDGNDHLFGGAGRETFYGESGADLVEGGGGGDDIYGGGDRIVFARLSDSPDAKGQRDSIFSFLADTFDLRQIDARSGHDGNQKFDFIDTRAFSGHAGELRYEQQPVYTYVTADIDGDRHADFGFRIEGAIDLKRHDFML